MDWIPLLNNSIDYIEGHILERIDYDNVARVAGCSSYHYQRMFSFLSEVPLAEYIRRRRMSLAAADLQNNTGSVLEIGMKYGYSSPTAFNRAFQSVHGIAPARARKKGTPLKSYPPLCFKMVVKGTTEMNYSIEAKPAFTVIGVKTQLDDDMEKCFQIVPAFWQQTIASGTLARLERLRGPVHPGILGVSLADDADQWHYMIAVISDQPAPAGMHAFLVPATNWAMFKSQGTIPEAIQELESRIVTEWFMTSGYEYVKSPDIEVYLNPGAEQGAFELWVPVKPRASASPFYCSRLQSS